MFQRSSHVVGVCETTDETGNIFEAISVLTIAILEKLVVLSFKI